jgi:large repetitive protein
MKKVIYFESHLSKSILAGLLLMLGFLCSSFSGAGQGLYININGPDSVAPGDTITYVITYSNNGTAIASGTAIVYDLPDLTYYTYVESWPSGSYSMAANQLTWNIGALGSGLKQIIVRLIAGNQGTFSYQDPQSYYMPDCAIYSLISAVTISATNYSDATSSTSTGVRQFVSARMDDRAGNIKPGNGSLTQYLMNVVNTGNVTTRFRLYYQDISCVGYPNTGNDIPGVFLDINQNPLPNNLTIWLKPGEQSLFFFRLNGIPTNANTYDCKTIFARDTVCSYVAEADVRTYVRTTQAPDLDMSKTDNPDPVYSGDTLVYTIFVYNSGGGDAGATVITEQYSSKVQFISANPAPTSGNNVWAIGTLPEGQYYIITVKVLVNANIPNNDTIHNIVNVLYYDKGNPFNESVFEITHVRSIPDLKITKTADPTEVDPDDEIEYTLYYENIGNYQATSIAILDDYNQAYTDYIIGSSSIAVVDDPINGTLSWSLGTIAAGSSGTITYKLKVKDISYFGPGSTTINNEAQITLAETDQNYGNNISQAIVNVEVLPDLYVEKVAIPNPAEATYPLEYKITWGNMGKIAHSGYDYVLVDYLPVSTVLLNPSTLPNGGVYDQTGHTITWTFSAALAVNAELDMSIFLDDMDCGFVGSELENRVTIWSAGLNDADDENNEFLLKTLVEDNDDPVISCVVNKMVDANSGTTYVHTGTAWDATATDNCSIDYYEAELTGATETMNPLSTLDGAVFNEGVTTVTWTAFDIAGNTDVCSFTVTVNAEAELAIIKSAGTAIAGQELVYTITVTNNGPAAAQNVVITDNITAFSNPLFTLDPVNGPWSAWTSPYNVTGPITPTGTYTIYIKGTLSINQCDPVSNTASVTSSNVDNTPGNNSYTLNTTVLDQTDPVPNCPTPAASYNADAGQCYASLTLTASPTDNCGVASTVYSVGGNTITFPYNFPVGTTTVNVLVTDVNNRTATCSYSVVVVDNQDPVPNCPTPAASYNANAGQCYASLTLTASPTDNCGVASTVYSVGGNTITFPYNFPVGTTTVNVLVTDVNNRTATCSYSVVVVDNQDPVPNCPTPAASYNADAGQCYASLTLTASPTDNCGVASTVYSVGGNTITFPYNFPVGTTTVNVLVTDVNNRTATCSYSVVVVDNQDPVPNCPTPAASYNADAGQCYASLTLTASPTDNCGVASTVYSVGGNTITFPYNFPVGTTTVNVLVTDVNNRTATCSYSVVVVDNQDPVPNCPTPAASYNADAGQCYASLTLTASPTDNCGVASTVYSVGGNTITFPYNFPVGTTTVNVMVTDVNNRTATCSYSVVVVDNQDPVPNCPTPAASYNADAGQCYASLTLTASPTDNCGVASTVYSVGGNTITFPYNFPVGTTTVNVLVTDVNNRTATCSYSVVVVDNQDPVPNCPTPAASYNADAGQCYASLTLTASPTDNCGVASTVYSVGGNTITFPYNFPVGTTTVNVLVTDVNNRTATCSYSVVVVDNQDPVPNCPTPAASYNANAGQCYASLTLTASPTDNCGVASTVYSVGGNTITFPYNFPVGTTTVNVMVTDVNNRTATCSFSVVVVDNQSPTFSTPSNTTVAKSTTYPCTYNAAPAVTGNPTSVWDNCDPNPAITHSDVTAPGTCPHDLIITRTWKVTDAAGNSTVSNQIITVEDQTPPTFTGPADITLSKDANCTADITPAVTGNPTNLQDNCDPAPGVSYTDASCFSYNITGQMNAGQGYYYPVQISGYPAYTAADLQRVEMEFTSNQGKGNVEFILIAPSGDGILLTGPYCSGGFCSTSGNQTYRPSFYASTSGHPAWDNANNIPTGPGNFTPYGQPSAVNTTLTGFNGTFRTKFEDLTGPMDGTWVLFGRKQGTPAGTMSFNGVCITPTGCTHDELIVRSWRATDACGNVSAPYNQTIFVRDLTAPVWTNPANDLDRTVECSDASAMAAAQALSPVATDNCDITLTPVKTSGTFMPGTLCPQAGTITNSWVVTDECGNTSLPYTQIITVVDNTPPLITAIPANTTVSCTNTVPAANIGAVVATDNCGGSVTITVAADVITNQSCPNRYTITRTYTATDACGNASSQSQTITVNDQTAPTITSIPANNTVSCASLVPAANTGAVVATDNCGGSVTITVAADVITNQSCPNRYTITRTYIATDACGNASSQSQTITVNDQTAPTITSIPANNTVSCASLVPAANIGAVVATDNCGGSVTITVAADVITNQSCPNRYTITRTYTATDACGNASSQSQIITVNDQTPPVIAALPAPSTIQCPAVPSFATAQATDNCGGTVTLNYTDNTTPGNCPQAYTVVRTWTATDLCGNVSTASQTIQVVDNTPPTFTGPADITLSKDANCTADITPAVTGNPTNLQDNCDPAPGVSYTDASCFSYNITGQMNAGQGYYYPVQISGYPAYTAADLQRVEMEFTSNQGKGNVEFILIAPSGDGILLTGPYCSGGFCSTSGNQTYRPSFYASTSGHPAWDNANNIPTGPGNFTPYGQPSAVNTTLTGFNGTFRTKFEDLTGPMDGTWVLFGRKQGTPAGTMSFNGVCITPTGCTHDELIVRSWRATDACGNVSAPYNQTIFVRDLTAPVWTNPANDLDRTVECSDASAMAAAQALSPVATDNCDITLTPVKTSGTFMPGTLCPQAGTITNSWVVTDECGNTSLPYTQIITVVDNTPPLITAIPANTTVSCTNTVPAANIGAVVATDNCGGSVTITVAADVITNQSCPNRYTITRTYIATDACGNASSQSQIITVNDQTPPVIAALPAPSTIQCPAVPSFASAQATDNCSGTVTLNYTDNTTPGNCPQAYTVVRTWTATDPCGNVATATQTIHVVDQTPPVITCVASPQTKTVLAPVNSYTTLGTEFDPVSLSDACGTVTLTNNINGLTSLAGYVFQIGTTVVTWTATDACGNTAQCSFTVQVTQGNQPPDVTCPSSITVPTGSTTCTALVTSGLSATTFDPDNNIVSLTWVMTGATTGSGNTNLTSYTFNKGITTITYTVTDAGNLYDVCDFTVTVVDQTPPVITLPAAGLTLQCFDASVVSAWLSTASANDNCDGAVAVVPTWSAPLTNCNQTVTVTFTAVDGSNNTAIATKNFFVNDNTPPVAPAAPANASYTCLSLVPAPGTLTATDNCSPNITVTGIDNHNNGAGCPNDPLVITRTWTFVDNCNNSSSVSQTITVIDNVAPLIAALPAPSTIQCPAVPSFASAQASDNCGGTVTLNFVDNTTPGNCPQAYTVVRTWTATDPCGNVATATQTIHVVDQTPPVITCVASPQTKTVLAPVNSYTTLGTEFDPVSLSDACGTVTLTNNINGLTSLSGYVFQIGTTVVTWTATDACGNTAQCSFTVQVTQGNHTATDLCGNTATATQTIQVADNTAPVIACVSSPQTKTVFAPVTTYITVGAEFDPSNVFDACGAVSVTNNINGLSTLAGHIFQTGTTVVTWIASDACGNTAQCSFTVNVTQGNQPPDVTCPPNITVPTSAAGCTALVTSGLSATTYDPDNNIVSLTWVMTGATIGSGNTNLTSYTFNKGITTITYTVTDAGNLFDVCDFTVTVVDQTPPLITLPPAALTMQCYDAAVVTAWIVSASAHDNCDGPLSVSQSWVAPPTNCNQTVTVTFYAVDGSNNTAIATKDFIVNDNTPPVAPAAPANASYTCLSLVPAPGTLTATDNCSPNITVTGIDNHNNGAGCPNDPLVITRTWTFVDNCNNSSSVSQTITVIDNVAPVIALPPAPLTMQCYNASLVSAWAATATATDNCSGTLNVTPSWSAPATNCNQTVTVTFTAMDACGNVATATKDFNVNDITPPAIVCAAFAQTRSVQAPLSSYITQGAEFDPTGIADNCGGIVAVTNNLNNSASLAGYVFPAGTTTVIWTATDVCGNTAQCSFNVVISISVNSILAVHDYGTPVNGFVGGVSVPDVLVNDLLNALPVNPVDVILTMVYSPNAGITMSGSSVVVAAGTPAGTYGLVYRICEVAYPANCDTAIVYVVVDPPSIFAIHDYGAPVNGFTGGIVLPNVLVNDILHGLPVLPAQINLTFITSSHPGVILNGNGVEVAPGTPQGQYYLIYRICEVLNPANCDTAIVFVPVNYIIQACLSPKVILQGAFDPATGLMWDSLRAHNYIPATEPYSSAPYNTAFTHMGGGGGETVASPSMVFGLTGNNAIVDWVFVELRDRNNSSNVLYTRAALLQRDGDIVDVDGVSPLCFNGLSDNWFYIAVRHRNHLGVMTATPRELLPSGTVVDFRSGTEPEFSFGNTLANGYNYTGLAQKQLTIGTRGLWAGNVDMDNKVKYQAGAADRSALLAAVLNYPGNIFYEYNFDFAFGYLNADVDLSGKSKYQGTQSDRSLILGFMIDYPLNYNGEYNFDYFLEQLP